jgi:myosin heavy subunit
METLSNEIKELGEQSTLSFSRDVYTCDQIEQAPSGQQRSSIRGVSVGNQFRTNLQKLVDELDSTQPHYVRCIKPNLAKSPASFLSGEVLKQLRYSGMMEAIRIRREGYALREDHETFYARFSVLLNSDDVNDSDAGIEELVRVLSKRLGVTEADWQIGHSKIFLRRELSDKLERLAKLRVHSAARTIARFGQRIVSRRLAKLLVAWVRFRLRMKAIYRRHRAATKISSIARRNRDMKKYGKFRRSIVKIQAAKRRQTSIRQVRLMRDPYCEMTFRDCRSLLKSEQTRLEKAVQDKDFRLAAELEAKMYVIIIVYECVVTHTTNIHCLSFMCTQSVSNASYGSEATINAKVSGCPT